MHCIYFRPLDSGWCGRQIEIANLQRHFVDLFQRLIDSSLDLRIQIDEERPAHDADAWFSLRLQPVRI